MITAVEHMLATKLDEDRKREILLPLSLGGLGLADLHLEAENGYVASVLATLQRWRGIVPDSSAFLQTWVNNQQPDSSLQVALQSASFRQNKAADVGIKHIKLPPLGSAVLSFSNTKKLQQQLSRVVHLHTKYTLINTTLKTVAERAMFRSKSGPASSAFLQAVPSDRGLTMSNQDFVAAVRLYLRLPLVEFLGGDVRMHCFCAKISKSSGAPVLCDEHHVMNCAGSNARTSRHDTLKNNFHEMLQSTHLQPRLEQLAGVVGQAPLLFDVTAKDVDALGTHLKLDITVRNPATKKGAGQAAIRTLYAATRAVKEKNDKYGPLLDTHDRFLAVAFETFGAMHPNVREAIVIASRRVNHVPVDSATFAAPTFLTYWTQRFSVCLWRENAKLAALVVGRSAALRGHWSQDDDSGPSSSTAAVEAAVGDEHEGDSSDDDE